MSSLKLFETMFSTDSVATNNVAIISKYKQLTYKQLDEYTNILGANLLKNYKSETSRTIGICMHKSIDAICMILAAIRAGFTYLPLDPDDPIERLKYLIQDAQCDLVITSNLKVNKKIIEAITNVKVCEFNIFVQPNKTSIKKSTKKQSRENEIFQIIYTSGSTGLPKGIEITTVGILNRICWMKETFSLKKGDRVLQKTPLTFDVSVGEILWTLSSGATLVVPEQGTFKNLFEICTYVKEFLITHVHFVPAMLTEFLNFVEQSRKIEYLDSLKVVFCSGERLNKDVASLALRLIKIRLFNIYGPSETGEVSAYEFVNEQLISSCASVPIGKPINNTEFYLLDSNGQNSNIGELYISGNSVARGYLNRPKENKERFTKNPWSEKRKNFSIMYKTGDYVKLVKEGSFEFLERVDDQIKFNGIRIEPTEIEHQARLYKGIDQVLVRLKNNKFLCIYYSSHDKKKTKENDFKDYLSKKLPAYMMPSIFLEVDSFPITSNWKIDVKKLENIQVLTQDKEIVTHLTDVESKVYEIWKYLFDDSISVSSNFFDIGGQSMLAIRMCGMIYREFGVWLTIKDIYKNLTIKSLSNVINKNRHFNIIVNKDSNSCIYLETFPMNDIQKAYYIGRQKIYGLGGIETIDYREIECRDFDHKQLENSLNIIIKHTPALRLEFYDSGDQRILEKVPFYHIETIDLTNHSIKEVKKIVLSLRNKMLSSSLNKWPYFSFNLVKHKNNSVLHFYINALIMDAHSFNLFFSAWSRAYYNLYVEENQTFGFKEYVIAFNSFKKHILYENSRDYWKKRIPDFPMAPELPLKNLPEKVKKVQFKRLKFTLPKYSKEKLDEKCKLYRVTPALMILSVYAKILQRWSSKLDFSLNVTQFKRYPFNVDVDNIIGEFTGLLSLAIYSLERDHTFLQWLLNIQKQFLQDEANSLYDGVLFQRDLAKHHNKYHGGLIPVVYTCTLSLTEMKFEEAFPEHFIKTIFETSTTSQVWLDCQVTEENEEIHIAWDYVEDLFDKVIIEDMFNNFFQLMKKCINGSWEESMENALLEDIAVSQDTLKDKLPSFKLLHEKIIADSDYYLNKKAVICDGIEITYERLLIASNLVKNSLVNLGLKKESKIAILLPKSIEQIVAVLGVLMAECVYVPINYEEAICRCEHIFEKSEVSFILISSEKKHQLDNLLRKQSIKSFIVDKNVLDSTNKFKKIKIPVFDPNSLAYVIFTSGSTGMPKGVMMSHLAVCNTLDDINSRYNVKSNDKVLSLSSLSFDLSVYDIFGILSAGGCVVLPLESEIKNPEAWLRLLISKKITIWNSVPAFMQMLLDYLDGNHELDVHKISLRLVLLSGDWIPTNMPVRIKRLFPHCKVISLGGATEAAIWSVLYDTNNFLPDKKQSSIPYGKAMENQKIYILNDQFSFCPPMVIGKIFLAGMGLSLGYMNDAEITAKSFILHPKTKERLYDTGDIGKLLPDGNIEFIGRNDFQLKISGYRVELAEVEKVLNLHHGIVKSIVVAQKNILTAFIKLSGKSKINILTIFVPDKNKLTNSFLFGKEENNSKLIREIFLGIDTFCQKNMIKTLVDIGILSDIQGEIKLKISKDYNYLIKDWINFLHKQNVLAYNNKFKKYTVNYKLLSNADSDYLLLKKNNKKYSEIFQYVEKNINMHLNFLTEKSDPREVLFSDNDESRALEFYNNPLDGYYLKAMASLIKHKIKKSCFSGKIRILELGSGVGSLLWSLWNDIDENIEYTFTDISPYFLQYAKNRFGDSKNILFKKLDFNVSVIEQGFTRKSYDLVISYNALHNARDLKKTLTYVNELLVPSGNLIIIEGHEENAFFLSTAAFMMKGFVYNENERNAILLTREEWKRSLKNSNFCNLKFYSSRNLDYGDFDYSIISAQSSGELVDRNKINAYLSKHLPSYMIPKNFIVVQDFPLNNSGKIDRKLLALENSLEKPKNDVPVRSRKKIDKVSLQLMKLFSKVLDVDSIRPDDDFFELGGDSLSVVRLLSLINLKLGKMFNVQELNLYRSVNKLKEYGWSK